MSLWRRAPRQVYCVYGQDEYVSDGHPAGETEPPHDEPESDFLGRAPEVGVPAPGARSRGPRLIGVGLLLGAAIGAGGLVVSHLHGQSSPPGAGASAPSAAHPIPPASSGSERRAPGASSARPDLQARSNERPASPAGTPESSLPGVADGPGGGSTATPSAQARQTVVARRAKATADVRVDAPTESPSPTAASAPAGAEFEFER